MTTKINITSTVAEKGIDAAKGFLDKLIVPAIEETGLLIKDKVASWRFNNQVKILNKAKAKCEKNGIKPKAINLKLLVPFLENASLEEEEEMQDKWANLLSNLVDSEQNIENHVFPYLLSQISLSEFNILEKTLKDKRIRIARLDKELDLEVNLNVDEKERIRREINEIKNEEVGEQLYVFNEKLVELEIKLNQLEHDEKEIKKHLKAPEYIMVHRLKEFEISNLVRLGLSRSLPIAYPRESLYKSVNSDGFLEIDDIEIEIDAKDEILVLSQLGEMFITVCTEKKKQYPKPEETIEQEESSKPH